MGDRLVAWAAGHGVEEVRAGNERPGLRPLADQHLDLARLEAPVDRVDDDALAGAREVQLDVGRRVLGQRRETVAGREAETVEPRGQRVDAAPKLREAPFLAVFRDQREPVAEGRRVADEDVVEREVLNVEHGGRFGGESDGRGLYQRLLRPWIREHEERLLETVRNGPIVLGRSPVAGLHARSPSDRGPCSGLPPMDSSTVDAPAIRLPR